MRLFSTKLINVGAAAAMAATMLVTAHGPTSAQTSQKAKVQTLRLGYLENNPQWVPTMDPAVVTDQNSSWLAQLIHQGLVGLKMHNGKVIAYPQLARNWVISKDGKTYTFNLRSNARFSDGHQVTAQDVVFSVRRALSPTTASPVASYDSLIAGYDQFVKGTSSKLGINALGKTKVQIKIKQRAGYFLYAFTYPINMVLEQRVLKGKPTNSGGSYVTTSCKSDVGAGQFKPVCQNSKTNDVTSYYAAGSTPTLTLVANTHYYGRKPALKLVIPAYDSNQTGYSDFLANHLDLTWGVPSTYQSKWRGKTGAHQYGSSGIEYLAPNLDEAPFNNVHCRLAVAYAIDRETLTKKVLKGAYKPLYTVVPPGFVGYYAGKKTSPHFDPNRVKKELAQCTTGIHITYVYRNDTTDRRASAEALASMLNAQGMDVKTKGVPRADWLKIILHPLKDNHVALVYDDWFMDYPDSQDYLDVLLRTGQPQNCAGWNNSTYNHLINLGNAASSPAKRAKYYIQAQKLVLSKVGFIGVDNFTNFDLVNTHVRGLEPNYANGVEWPVNNDWANVSKK